MFFAQTPNVEIHKLKGGDLPMFNLTGSAYQILQNAIKNESDEGEKLFVRLTMGIGWGGPQLKVALEERPLTKDKVFTFDDVAILIHEQDYVYFKQTKLDYIKDVFGMGKFILIKK